MQRLEVSCAVRRIYSSLGAKGLINLKIMQFMCSDVYNFMSRIAKKRIKINPLNAELNPICHMLALVGAHHILHASRVRIEFTNWFVSIPHSLKKTRSDKYLKKAREKIYTTKV